MPSGFKSSPGSQVLDISSSLCFDCISWQPFLCLGLLPSLRHRSESPSQHTPSKENSLSQALSLCIQPAMRRVSSRGDRETNQEKAKHTGKERTVSQTHRREEGPCRHSSFILPLYLSFPLMGSRWLSPRRFSGFRARCTLTRNSIQG